MYDNMSNRKTLYDTNYFHVIELEEAVLSTYVVKSNSSLDR